MALVSGLADPEIAGHTGESLEASPPLRRAPRRTLPAISPQPSYLRNQSATNSLPSRPYPTAKTKVRATPSPSAAPPPITHYAFLIPNCPPAASLLIPNYEFRTTHYPHYPQFRITHSELRITASGGNISLAATKVTVVYSL